MSGLRAYGSILTTPANSLDIPGLRDVVVKNYSNWQQSKINNMTLKVEFQKACDLTLTDSLDLE